MVESKLSVEWADIISDLDRLQEVAIEQDDTKIIVRTQTGGMIGKIFKAVGLALPPLIRQVTTKGISDE